MDLGMKGRSYVLVGGTRGMGWEAARCLAAEGANVALLARDGTNARERAAELASTHGVKTLGISADGTDRASVDDAIAESIATLGPIRGLLVTTGATDHNGALLDMDDDDWQRNFDDVLMGTVRPCRSILPHLLEHGGGNIVTTAAYSSRSAKSFLFGYAALKAAIVNFTKNVAKTYGREGIRANCVAPGAVETDLVRGVIDQTAAERGITRDEAQDYVMTELFKMPVGLARVGQASELGEVMAFLLSERGAYLTGGVLNVDGGTDF